METLKATIHLYGAWYDWDDKWHLVQFNSADIAKLSDDKTHYVYLKAVEIEATMPEIRDITMALVASLRERQAAILAEARLAHTKIEERIQTLMALPHHG